MQLNCLACQDDKRASQSAGSEELTTDCDRVATVTKVDAKTRLCSWLVLEFDGEHSLFKFSH